MINNIMKIALFSNLLIFITTIIITYIVLMIAVSKNLPENKTKTFFLISGWLTNVTFFLIVICLLFFAIKMFI